MNKRGIHSRVFGRFTPPRTQRPKLKGGQARPRLQYPKPRGSLRSLKVWRDPVRYGYAAGRIKVRERDLLNWQRLGRLIEADFPEALHILEEVDYGNYLKEAKVAAEVDAGLMRFLRDLYEFLGEITPRGSHIRDFLLARYDFHNLKVLLKERCCDGGHEELLLDLGTLAPEAMREALANPPALPEHLRDAAVETLLTPEPTSQQVDTVLDRRFLEYRLELARKEKSGFMEEHARAALDLANVKALLRARNLGKGAEFLERALAEGGELEKKKLVALAELPLDEVMRELDRNKHAGPILPFLEVRDDRIRLSDYDRLADDLMMTELHRAKHIASGAEPILGYVRGRENDVTVLRIVLMGKLHNLAPAAIEKHVRTLYGEVAGQ